MRAGMLNRIVTLQRATAVDNGQGGQDQIWSTVATFRAHAVPVGGSEGLVAGTLQSQQGWRLTIRRRAVSTQDRILMNGQTLAIVSVADPDGRNERLVLMCEFRPT